MDIGFEGVGYFHVAHKTLRRRNILKKIVSFLIPMKTCHFVTIQQYLAPHEEVWCMKLRNYVLSATPYFEFRWN